LELLSAEKDHLQEVGEELVGLIGEPDKPEVERGIEDMDAAFKALDEACDARQRTLDEALRRTSGFHDELAVSLLPRLLLLLLLLLMMMMMVMMMMMMMMYLFLLELTCCTILEPDPQTLS